MFGGGFGGLGLEDGRNISLLNLSLFFTLLNIFAAFTAHTF